MQDEFLIYHGRILTWEKRKDEVWMLLKNVEVHVHDPDLNGSKLRERKIKIDHLWVIQSHESIKSYPIKFERLDEIRFQGKPYKYKRADGSFDYAISSVGVIHLDACYKQLKKALYFKRWKDIIHICTALNEGWEKHGLPLTTWEESTNQIVNQNKELIRQCLKEIKREDKLMRHRLSRKKANYIFKKAKGFK
jgi:hypothetical protein